MTPRLVTYGAACSLDGFVTGPDGSMDWLHFSDDVRRFMAEYWAGVDTVLMGRRTWEVAAAAGGGGSAAPTTKAYVFSRTLPPGAVPGGEVVSEDAASFVRSLKASPGRNICLLGGGELAASLLDAGVVDEIGVNLHPVRLGGGVPFLAPGPVRTRLELSECRPMDGGCVLLTYRVIAG